MVDSSGTGINWTKPIGPLPTGAWAALVVGMLGLAYYNRTKANATVPASTVVDNTSGIPGVGVGGWIATPAPTDSGSSSTSTTVTTNDMWAQQAITWLISQGYDPGVSDAAIRNYINGQSLTTQQQALVDTALKHFGAPPETLTPPNSNPTPIGGGITAGSGSGTVSKSPAPISHPSPAPAPHRAPSMRYIKVTPWPGTPYDSLAKIAREFYGADNRWPTLFNANRAGFTRPDGSKGWITNPSLIYPGRTIWVP